MPGSRYIHSATLQFVGPAAPSFLAAKRRLVLLFSRIVCLLVDECRGLGERGGAGPGRDGAVEPTLLDAPLRPLRQQAERRVGVVGEVGITDQARRGPMVEYVRYSGSSIRLASLALDGVTDERIVATRFADR